MCIFEYIFVSFARGFGTGMFFTLYFILGVLSCEVYAHVCHVYQEPNGRGPGKRPRWWISEAKPCECTEMRLGGINMVSYNRPYEGVTFLLNGVLISTDPKEIQDFWGREDMSASQSPEGTSDQHQYRSNSRYRRIRHSSKWGHH